MDQVRTAFRDECARLGEMLSGLDSADFDRPTGCEPWTVAELLAHVRTGAGRLADMLAAPAPARALVDAAGYFGRAKFTPEVDAARIDAARIDAARIDAARIDTGRIDAGRMEPVGVRGASDDSGTEGRSDDAGPAAAAAFDRAWRRTLAAVDAYPSTRVVRTRHGDLMTVTEFLRTRVVEVGVHGLDLAAALDRPPWLTATAGQVIVDLLTGGRPLPAQLGWDRLTLIAKATGRVPTSGAEHTALTGAGLPLLSFGRPKAG